MTKSSKKGNIEEVTAQLVSSILQEDDFRPKRLELVEVEYKKEDSQWFLRVFIDKEGGVDIEECSRVSEQLSKRLDEQDPIAGAYILEVSSPGAERPLKTERDVQRAIGKEVQVSTYEPVDGKKEHLGQLKSVSETDWVLSEGRLEVHIPREKIARARLTVSLGVKL